MAQRMGTGAPRLGALWFGLLAGPLAWAVHLSVSYFLNTVACATSNAQADALLHPVTALAALVAAAGGVVAWSAWQRLRELPDSTPRGTPRRSRFMALAGLISSSIFLFAILLGEVPVLLLPACLP